MGWLPAGSAVWRKETVLGTAEKLNIIEKLELRVPVGSVTAKCGTGLTTVKGLKKNGDGIWKFSVKFEVGGEKAKLVRKTLKLPACVEL